MRQSDVYTGRLLFIPANRRILGMGRRNKQGIGTK
nr:MAG TPA: hypothetical protein [Caudoviricetes sp.]